MQKTERVEMLRSQMFKNVAKIQELQEQHYCQNEIKELKWKCWKIKQQIEKLKGNN